MRHSRWLIGLVMLLALIIASAAVGCGDDDDDDDNDNDDQTPDDDDTIDDDDNDDDDSIDDDSIDDDTGDDDTVDDLPPPTYGWILMSTDRAHLTDVMNKAADFNIDNVHLSHGLIMEIDEINEDEAQAQMLQEVAQEAHALDLDVWVWSHEFTDVPAMLCFDPEAPVWDERQDAYREALARIPEIDGVILMFGSADMEPWYIPCYCDWCLELEPTGNPLLDAIHSRPADRAQQIYDAVGEVVVNEFGKQLRMRTFMHQVLEIGWLGKSLRTYPHQDLMVMTKDVPQDWQPYYPHNPLIGHVGHRHQIIEMDLGNEYWGKSSILNGQVDYIYYRYSYDREVGARGAAARIERGGDSAFGNPNEINIYAFTRLLQDETATPDQVYREWFDDRYGFDDESDASDVMKTIFRNSHYAMRKMYYTLGMWTMEKGSDVTTGALFPEQLWTRATIFYDLEWSGVFFSLILPGTQTLIDLWQESNEAMEIAADNLALLESIEGDFADPDDYTELHEMLELHRDCTEVWRLVKDVVWRWQYTVLGHWNNGPYLEYDAQRLLELADEMEARWGAGVSPGNPGRIRDFVDNLYTLFPGNPIATQYSQPRLSDIEAEDLGDGRYLITWQSSDMMTSQVEWSTDLPRYENTTGEVESLRTTHEMEIEIDEPGRTCFRVGGHANGTLIRSGDFWLGLDDY